MRRLERKKEFRNRVGFRKAAELRLAREFRGTTISCSYLRKRSRRNEENVWPLLGLVRGGIDRFEVLSAFVFSSKVSQLRVPKRQSPARTQQWMEMKSEVT